jgi:hypothetical protein
MIRQALDTATIFLKHFINDKRIGTMMKPKELYNAYEEYMAENEKKKQVMNKNTFLAKLKECTIFAEFFTNKKYNGAEPTNYIKIDRNKMIEHFRKKSYFDEYDEIHDFTLPLSNEEENEFETERKYTKLQKDYDELLEKYKKLEDKLKSSVFKTIQPKANLNMNDITKMHTSKKDIIYRMDEINEIIESIKSSSKFSEEITEEYKSDCDTTTESDFILDLCDDEHDPILNHYK